MPASTGSPWDLPWPTASDAPDGPDLGEDLARKLGDPATGVIGQAWAHTTASTLPTHKEGRIAVAADTGLVVVGVASGRWRKLSGPQAVLATLGRGGSITLTTETVLGTLTVAASPALDGLMFVTASVRMEVPGGAANLRGFIVRIRRDNLTGTALGQFETVATTNHVLANAVVFDDYKGPGARTYVVTMQSDNSDSVAGTLMNARLEQ